MRRALSRGLSRGFTFALGALLYLALGAVAAFAQDESPKPTINSGDTAWMLASSALVLFMTPGLAFFYGGLVRSKNVLGTMMQSLVAMAVISVTWVLVGYTLSFGTAPDPAATNGYIGSLGALLLKGVGGSPNANYSGTIPELVWITYQGMFAIITPALIGGAIAERMKFKSWLLFMTIWNLAVYCPLAHWVWGYNGWLGTLHAENVKTLGALDFAGGTVVHISSGVSALVAAIVIGKRRDFPRNAILPHNLPFAVLGAGMLWFGWFGFNGGSALAANDLAAFAFVNTNTAAAAAALAWMFNDWVRFGKPTALGTISGAVAGLVGITPAAGFVTPGSAIIIGIVSALCCATFVHWRTRRAFDDSLDAFGVHGVGGTVGALLTGVFAVKAVNPIGSGLLDGNSHQLVVQAIGVGVTYVFAGGMAFVILMVVKAICGLKVTDDDDAIGLDQTQHGETAYSS